MENKQPQQELQIYNVWKQPTSLLLLIFMIWLRISNNVLFISDMK